MLTKPQLARYVHSSGLNDPGFAENEVVLTYLLQLLVERGFIKRVVFKGGTCIRKMLLGNRGRFSTDLDFTARTEVSDPDGEILALAEVFEKPFHEIQFRLDLGNEKEWRSTERTTWSVYPTYAHGLGSGSIKFEVSLRETPILEPALLPQLPQAYFTHLEFEPAALPCLHECELIAEKLRAAYQRRKARDVYDLAVFANRPRQEQLIRKALVLKLWNVRDSFDPAAFDARLAERRTATTGTTFSNFSRSATGNHRKRYSAVCAAGSRSSPVSPEQKLSSPLTRRSGAGLRPRRCAKNAAPLRGAKPRRQHVSRGAGYVLRLSRSPPSCPPCQHGIVSGIPAHPQNYPPSRRISVHVAPESRIRGARL